MNTLTTLLRVPQINGAVGGLLGSWRTLFTRPQLPSTLNSCAKPTSLFGIGGTVSGTSSLLNPFEGMLGGVSGRTNIRNHFPRPSEVRRIKRHGWRKRMSTAAGRRILMNRILKGRFIYSH